MALATVAESRLLAAGRSREQNSAVGRLGGSKYHTANGPPNYQAAKPPSRQATKPPSHQAAKPSYRLSWQILDLSCSFCGLCPLQTFPC